MKLQSPVGCLQLPVVPTQLNSDDDVRLHQVNLEVCMSMVHDEVSNILGFACLQDRLTSKIAKVADSMTSKTSDEHNSSLL